MFFYIFIYLFIYYLLNFLKIIIKIAVTTLYKALAQQYKNRLVFAQAAMSDKALAEKFNVESAPTLLVTPVNFLLKLLFFSFRLANLTNRIAILW